MKKDDSAGKEVKGKFAAMLRQAREKQGLTRKALGDILGVNFKTVQSWEVAHSFPSKLELLYKIENLFDISFSELVDNTFSPLSTDIPENEEAYGSKRRVAPGPVPVDFVEVPDVKGKDQGSFITIPVIRELSDVSDDCTVKNPSDWTVVPAQWIKNKANVAAYVNRETILSPDLLRGDTLIIDLKANTPSKALGKLALVQGVSGLRVRKFQKNSRGGYSCLSNRFSRNFEYDAEVNVIVGAVFARLSKI